MTEILDLGRTLAARFYRQGVALEEAGEMDGARLAFERAVLADGAMVDARLALAYHLRRLDRLDEALAHCQAAVESHPAPASLLALGEILLAQRRYDEAIRALVHCLEIAPHFPRARHQLAFGYYLKGEYEVAITEFHRALHGEPEWESLFFLGECYRVTRRPAEAIRVLQKALGLARSWGQVELSRAQLSACRRLDEFPDQMPLGPKERAYCDCGVVYLGSSMDDGLRIPPYLFYHFRYEDLARTLHRLLALKQAYGWEWSAIVPVDIVSLPLALALARRLGVGTEPETGHNPLLVQAIGETVEGLQDASERLDGARTFCLLTCWPEEWRPDLVGVATPLAGSLPWFHTGTLGRLLRAGAASEGVASPPTERWMDSRPPETIADEILAALDQVTIEPTLPAQVAYYRDHSALRWL